MLENFAILPACPCCLQEVEEDAAEMGASSGASTNSDVGGPKFLVFAHHKTVMNRIAAALEGAKQYAAVNYVRIDGGTDHEDRCVPLENIGTSGRRFGILLSMT